MAERTWTYYLKLKVFSVCIFSSSSTLLALFVVVTFIYASCFFNTKYFLTIMWDNWFLTSSSCWYIIEDEKPSRSLIFIKTTFWRLFKLMFKLILILAKVIMHLSICFHVVWNVGMLECRVFLQTFITQIYSPLPGNSSLSVWYSVFVLRIPFELKRRRPNDLCMREYINTLATEFAVCITINRVLTVTIIA